ncbi:sugar porter family MFS transporter [Clostridium oryzae]|uniref:Putative metabolite transport protein CsbC n=1 Tax=Clostridium oryzae TaxID=1450648 RepID=A0A1V4IMS8_9CLOT|nr:sugar porter family MFS transporter [Clostridium oryzae]OPJ61206.1 putative metabolite transport protein CsbC [Clostridium oryzae]
MSSRSNNLSKSIYIFLFFGSLAGILYGYAVGSISLALPPMTKDFAMSSTLQGFAGSFVMLGALPAIIGSTILEKKIERKKLLVIAGIIFIISTIGGALAPSANVFLFFRFVLGLGVGVANMYSLIYIVELAPANIRGIAGSMYQLCVNVGIFISYIAGAYFTKTGNWKAIILIGAVPAAIFVIGMAMSPASPRWLIRDKQIDKAKSILRKIRSNEAEVKNEILEVQKSLSAKDAGVAVLLKYYKSKVSIVFVLAFFQVFTGINAVIFYVPIVFKNLNMHNVSIIADISVGIALVIGTFCSLFLVDRKGRRFLLMTSFLMQTFPLVLIGMFPTNGVLDVICVFVYIFAFSVGLGPVYGLYVPEAFPLHVRAAGCGIITFCQYTMNFILTAIFPSIFNAISFNTFYVFGFLSLAALVFVYYKVPETKGKSLEKAEVEAV